MPDQSVVDHEPVAKRSTNALAGIMGMASSLARESFDAPGASPTTTQYVFFDTDPGEVPPRATIASSAPSRVNP
jgi:hypothetical protein